MNIPPIARALCLLLIATAAQLQAQVPILLNYQGRVAVGDPPVNFDGAGSFKFAFVNGDGSITYWSNDGTSAAGSEPTAAVSLAVTKGLYSVLLGDTTLTNMTAIPVSVFTNPDVRVRVWFDDGSNGSQLLTPDQRIAAVGYAIVAANAASVVDGAITSAKLADGAIGATQLADGSVTSAKLAPAISIPKIQTGSASMAVIPGPNQFNVAFPTALTSAPAVTISASVAMPTAVLGTTATGFSGSLEGPAGFGASTVDSAGNVGRYTSLAVVDGKPAISYSDTTRDDLKFAINAAADGSGGWTLATVDSAGDVGRWTSLAVVDGRPAISYNASNTALKFAINAAADGSGAWTLATVDSAGIIGSNTSLAVVDGKPAISYHDSPNGNLKFAINTAADGSAAWTLATVDSAGSVGQLNSLAVVDGKPAISYWDQSNEDLKFAINAAADGSGAWNLVTVDSVGEVGRFSSLAVVDGRPAISYSDAPNSDLRFAINAVADGTGAWTLATVDTAGNVGEDTSLAVVDGKPTISYSASGGSGYQLKFAINSAADGSGAWTLATVDSGGVGQYTSLAVVDGKPAISYLNVGALDLKFWIPPTVNLTWIAVEP